ncbi:MAG: IS200/IS605 family transposase, partial [Desulfobacteraceae bacterium]|nr:IS200/IS605 family transposase [Desulfobacteraceae bacterium]
TLKTISSRQLRKELAGYLKNFYSKPVLWSRSYCIVSAGGASLSVIKRYIENQNSGIHPDTGATLR